MPLAAVPGAAADARLVALRFGDIDGWEDDDHEQAFAAFIKSSGRLVALARAENVAAAKLPPGLLAACAVALARPASTRREARAFFEGQFSPHRVVHAANQGLLTGYFEPLVAGSRVACEGFGVPIYRRPPDLVNVVDESQRGAKADALTHLRRTSDGALVPYATRAEIEAGALAGRGLELMWFADPVDVFFMQVQGSACVVLPDGQHVRLAYDGKNGHAYTSIGRRLLDMGAMREGEMSLATLDKWLRADAARGAALMQENKSYVFFRELTGADAQSALGVFEIPLTAGRSLAVDTGFHAIGSPIWVSAPSLRHSPDAEGAQGFRRLMVAQDVGSAIRGPERGDIYFGSGAVAGATAGVTKHAGNFAVLVAHAPGEGVRAEDPTTPAGGQRR